MTETFGAILGEWESDEIVASDLDVPYSTVAAWRHRNSIPAHQWAPVVRCARARGYEGVTYERLAIAAEQKRMAEKAVA